jgi:hypothetical protein
VEKPKPIAYEVFEVREYDDSENGGHSIGFFLKEGDAVRAARGRGSWGADGHVIPRTIYIFRSSNEYDDHVIHITRESASWSSLVGGMAVLSVW